MLKTIAILCLVGCAFSVPVVQEEDVRFFGLIDNLFGETTTSGPSATATASPTFIENIINLVFPTFPTLGPIVG